MMRLGIEVGSAIAMAVVARLVVSALLKRGRLGDTLDAKSRRTIANSLALLVLVVSLVLILSGRNEVIRQDLLVSTISFMPKLLVGAVVVIVTFVLAKLAGVVVEQAVKQRSELLAMRARGITFASIVVVGVLLAMKQMGLQTDILMIIVAGVILTGSLAAGLGIGLGTLPLSKQIAAGRHVEDRFSIGQQVQLTDVSGRIASMNMASVEIVADDGAHWEVPYMRFIDEAIRWSDD
ncbi:MAG: mechanosensitive ion channel [Acidimicrobiia bacterium]|nr:mechanosensitive ion channel [Acidimicrobiia bacterium]MDH4307821.1 mechanosensitive ion channel [Acidimicrobiia bacterium]MDH5293869.1 mechanosensitive ion channel [Acidimicrobiia bacterium]